MAYAHDASPPARRRVALRTVPATPHVVVPEPVARLAMPAEEQNFLETLRKLWRHRLLIASCTLVIGSAAVLAAWLMPSYYVSEARVLVGVQSPRLPNVESIVADVSPDAERVQNEGFILQSRLIAKQVIDQLKLRDNPEFNPELARPSFWARLDLQQLVPASVRNWFDRQTSTTKVEPIKEGTGDDRTIDALLGHVDVSTLGRSHVLSIKADARNPATAAAIANALAERYLEYQRRDKIDQMDRVDKFLVTAATVTSLPSSSPSSTPSCWRPRPQRRRPIRGSRRPRSCARAASTARACPRSCARR
jgi:polysaccharide biosynthesis transport protein